MKFKYYDLLLWFTIIIIIFTKIIKNYFLTKIEIIIIKILTDIIFERYDFKFFKDTILKDNNIQIILYIYPSAI